MIVKRKAQERRKVTSLEVSLWSHLGLSAVYQKCPLHTHTASRNVNLKKVCMDAFIKSFTAPEKTQITVSVGLEADSGK